MAAEPIGLIANKGIELLTGPTPNGYKVSILLEELKDAYDLEYTHQYVPIGRGTQKQAWYTAINPNGKIPAIYDHDWQLAVMESAAILSYLARTYDRDYKFHFIEEPYHTDQEQWLFWSHGELGPTLFEAGYYFRFSSTRNHEATNRYVGKAERLYGVLDKRLADRDFVAGPGRGEFSIADIACAGWVNSSLTAGVDVAKFEHVKAWFERVYERPAVQRGFGVPTTGGQTPLKKYDGNWNENQQFRAEEEDLWGHLKKAQEEGGYKYQSP